jgi:hypothetical protein
MLSIAGIVAEILFFRQRRNKKNVANSPTQMPNVALMQMLQKK